MSSTFQQVWIESKRLKTAGVLSAVAVIVSGCSDGAESNATHVTVAHTIQPIIRGATSGKEHDAVVVLTTFRDGLRRSLCTATLIAPNLIITARHCVSDTDSSTACSKEGTPITGAAVKADRDPNSLVVFLGKSGLAPNTDDEANGIARGARLVVDPAATVCNRDVAFVVLDKKLDAPVAALRLGPPKVDEMVAAVGWGIDETGTLPRTREVRSDIPLIGIGPAMYPGHATYGYGDHEFMIGESACVGDSGSPAFAKTGAVIGVAARAGNGMPRDPLNYASTCMGSRAHAVYTHLASLQHLVTRAFQESGEAIWLEGQPDPRTPAPQTLPGEQPSAPPAGTTSEELPVAPSIEPKLGMDGGCSVSEPQRDAVESALGLVALLASLVNLRRRRKDDVTSRPKHAVSDGSFDAISGTASASPGAMAVSRFVSLRWRRTRM